jgi:hypothetical protein
MLNHNLLNFQKYRKMCISSKDALVVRNIVAMHIFLKEYKKLAKLKEAMKRKKIAKSYRKITKIYGKNK